MKKLKQPNLYLFKRFVSDKTVDEIATYDFRNENNSETKTKGIKGFKQYKINANTASKGKMFDADRSELNMTIWCLLLEEQPYVKEVYGYVNRNIIFKDEKERLYHVETDTMNSLETIINGFIRYVIKRDFGRSWEDLYRFESEIRGGKIIEKSSKKKAISKIARDQWFVENYAEIFAKVFLENDEAEYKVLQALEKWATYVHTIGNFMIGPVGFNYSSVTPSSKSRCFREKVDYEWIEIKNKREGDCLDVFLLNLQQNPIYSVWKQEITRYMNVNALDMYFEEENFTRWKDVTVKNLREGKTYEWIERIVMLIETRGHILAKQIYAIASRVSSK